jgi:hypothetical protein
MQSNRSMREQVERLQSYARESTVIRHFLEPSIKAPKAFYSVIPSGVENPKAWAECLLRIKSVDSACTVVGNKPSCDLAKTLWGEHGWSISALSIVLHAEQFHPHLFLVSNHHQASHLHALAWPSWR